MHLSIQWISLQDTLDTKPEYKKRFQFQGYMVLDPATLPLSARHALRTVQHEDTKEIVFVTRTHLWSQGHMFVPAFQLEPEEGENPEDFSLKFTADASMDARDMWRIPGTSLFTDSPKGEYKKDKEQWQFNYKNDATQSMLGAVHPGECQLILYQRGEVHASEWDYRLLVLPSSISYAQLLTMIQDILSVRRELVFLQKQAKVGVQGSKVSASQASNWLAVLRQLSSALSRLQHYLKAIDTSPRFRLQEQAQQLVTRHQLRRIDANVVQQYMQNPSRRKYGITQSHPSCDIYEHQLIRSKLLQLRDYMEAQQKWVIQQRKLNKQRKTEHAHQEDMLSKKVLRQLDDFLHLSVFCGVHANVHGWKLTQIFTNDPRYRAVYRILHELDEVLDFSYETNPITILHKKIDLLYEFWIYIRIVEVLVFDLQWQLEDSIGVIHAIDQFFAHNAKASAAGGSGEAGEAPCLTLTHAVPKSEKRITLKFFYNEPIYRLFPGMKALKRGGTVRQPDYFLRVDYDGLQRDFILDAKYRKYGDQPDTWDAYDLQEVCLKHYLIEPSEIEEHPVWISGAFIVHSDATGREDNPNRYHGKYVSFNATTDPRCLSKLKTELEPKFVKGKRQEVGSFYLVPYDTSVDEENQPVNDSVWNLKTFFSMLFSYYMDVHGVCWNCGSTHTNEEPTKSGKGRKYTCLDCRNNWWVTHCQKGHPLVKQEFNFHTEKQKHNKVSCICPECGNSL